MKKLNVSSGDTIEILQYVGEGYITACIENEEVEAYLDGPNSVSEGSVIEVSAPKADGWIRLKTPRSEIGFAKDEPFYQGYYDYEPNHFCDGGKPEGPKSSK